MRFLHQRCKQPQKALGSTQNSGSPALIFFCHFRTLGKNMFKSFRISFTASQLYKKPHFQMKIQTAIIHIDRATGCRFPVADTLFCMNKSRCVFINTHPLSHQSCIIRTCHFVDQFLSGIPGVTIRTSTPRFAASPSARFISSVMIRYGVVK